jgi:hypothetical protein
MAVSLSKGSKVSLAKVAEDAGISGGLTKILVGLGWDVNRYDGGAQFDLDASVFMLGANSKVRSEDDFIFYNKTSDVGSWSGSKWVADEANSSVVHTGDNRTGEGDGDDEQIKIGKGYDHNWVLNNKDGKLSKAAVLSEKSTGRMMEVWTTEPAIQIYCGNMIGGGKAQPNPITEKCGKIVPYRGAICLETQHYPDSPNKPQFPNTILKPGEVYSSVTEYRFGVTK